MKGKWYSVQTDVHGIGIWFLGYVHAIVGLAFLPELEFTKAKFYLFIVIFSTCSLYNNITLLKCLKQE